MLSRILNNFSAPGDDSRIMMRWWWFGPAVTDEGIEHQLVLMKNAGIGGVELAVIYPLCLDNEFPGIANARYMSDEFLASTAFAAKTAKKLGMRFDLTLCSGWPFGGPHISLEMSARKLCMREMEIPKDKKEIPLPGLEEGEALLKVFCEGRELSVGNNSILLPKAFGEAKSASLIISSFTGQRVKRAAVGSEGHVMDHYRKASLDIHLQAVGQQFIDAIGSENIHAVFTDSLEVFGSNWTENIFEEFKDRRGYRLEEHLSALFGEATEYSRNIRHDYLRTLTEMLNDNFLKPLQDFAAGNNVLSRVQAYGTPPATLNSYKYVDLPEGEAGSTGIKSICRRAGWKELCPNRIASSASKHYGCKITSAETWTFLHSPPYAATLLDMKAEADEFILQGINRIIGHGWPYSPEQAGIPGWVFYAAGNFNQTNSLYPAMHALSEYLQKTSALLSLGETVADIGLYLPNHDAWARYSAETESLLHYKAMRDHIGHDLFIELLRLGYNFELIDDDLLQEISENKRDGYPVIMLPNIERIPLETLEALKKCTCGKVVAYKRIPDKAPGVIENEKYADNLKKLAKEIFSDPARNTLFIENVSDLESLKSVIKPDVDLKQDEPETGYVHRRLGSSDIYFFVNTSNQNISFAPGFKTARKHALKLDPMTGNIMEYTGAVKLAPYESVFIVMSDDDVETPQTAVFNNRRNIDISTDWDIEFSGSGIRKNMRELTSWTEIEEIKHYSGEAVYSKKIELPELPDESAVSIFLGKPVSIEPFQTREREKNKGCIAFVDAPVKDAAIIFVNGQKVRTVFAPPYLVDISKYVKPGENLIEIKVYNRLTNKLSGEKPHDYSAVDEKYGKRFDFIQDFDALKPFTSGLTGKIELIVESCKV